MGSELQMKKCECCEGLTIPEDSVHEICDVCNWQQESISDEYPFTIGGANGQLSLDAAKRYWFKYRVPIPLALFDKSFHE